MPCGWVIRRFRKYQKFRKIRDNGISVFGARVFRYFGKFKVQNSKFKIEVFFQLIKIALGKAERFETAPTAEQWRDLFHEAQRQTLLGLLFTGVERLPAEQRPPRELILQWYTLVSRMEKMNQRMNDMCAKVQARFLEDGFRSCILKGQGMARYYDRPERRQCGDIDIWVEGGWKKVLPYVYKVRPGGRFVYHHVDFGEVQGIPVEVHFTPSWMYNPIHNRRLQRWFEQHAEECFSTDSLSAERTFVTPPRDFDLIYILLHAYRHIFDDGLGLRQLCDYYYLLASPPALPLKGGSPLWGSHSDCAGQQSEESSGKLGIRNEEHSEKLGIRSEELGMDYRKELRMLGRGFERFAKAVMWIMGEVFGLDREQMLIEPSEKHGRFLLQEVMEAGNFGLEERTRLGLRDGTWKKFFFRQKRNLRFLTSYPSEVLWRTPFIVYHMWWRMRAGREVRGER